MCWLTWLMDPLKDRETKESGCSWQKSSLTFGCTRYKLMTHNVHAGTVCDRAVRQASRYDRENAVLLCWHTYVNAFGRRQYLPDVMDYLPVRSITICWKKKSHQYGPPFIGQTMTRRHRLAYVQWARRHFIWQCFDWNRVSFSGETRLALSNAGGKTHKQALLGLLRAGKGSIWWGAVSWLWKNGWLEDVLCCHARQFQCIILTTSCDLMPYHFSITFTHKKMRKYLALKQNKKAIECNVFFCVCAKFPETCGYLELKRNKCDVPLSQWCAFARLGFVVQCFLVESNSLLLKNGSFFLFFCSFFLQVKWYIQKKNNHGNKYWCCEHAEIEQISRL